jgi:hypothetical protein
MNTTRTTRRSASLALVAASVLGTAAALSDIRIAGADAPIATRDADVRTDVGRGAYYQSRNGALTATVLTRADVDVNAEFGRSSVYAAALAHSGTIIGATDPGRAVFSRPDLTRPGRR